MLIINICKSILLIILYQMLISIFNTLYNINLFIISMCIHLYNLLSLCPNIQHYSNHYHTPNHQNTHPFQVSQILLVTKTCLHLFTNQIIIAIKIINLIMCNIQNYSRVLIVPMVGGVITRKLVKFLKGGA